MSHVIIVGVAVAFVLSSGLAMASTCKVPDTPTQLASNPTVAAQAVLTEESCTHNYTTFREMITETIIVAKPKHGTLEVVSFNGAKKRLQGR